MNELTQKIELITSRDNRYHPEAYLFLLAALGRLVEELETPRHVSGSELLEALRSQAREQFGPMSPSVFEYWGIKNSLDFGHIVFNMVHDGILSKEDKDSLEDFQDAAFFERLFDEGVEYQLHEISTTKQAAQSI